MKFVFACILFLAVLAWSSVNLIWTEFQFEKGYLEVDSAKICNVDTTYINCSQDRGLAYYSTMDTTFAVLFNPLITRVQLFKSLNVDEQRQAAAGYDFKMTAVLRYEFMKWQEWGIIKITRDSAQRLLDRILPEARDIQGRKIVHKKVCDEEMLSACRGEILWGGSGSPDFSEDDIARLPQKKVLLNAESVNPGTTSLKREFSKAIQGVGTVSPGTGFKAFDVNGIYLYRGTRQGKFKSHGRAVILKFENGRTAVFR